MTDLSTTVLSGLSLTIRHLEYAAVKFQLSRDNRKSNIFIYFVAHKFN
jgi:hypothetical protein